MAKTFVSGVIAQEVLQYDGSGNEVTPLSDAALRASPIPTAEKLITYSGGETIVPAGASAAATIPAGANCAIISAEGGAAYYVVNAAAASAASPGFVPENMRSVIPPIDNLTSLKVFGAIGVTVHIEYYED